MKEWAILLSGIAFAAPSVIIWKIRGYHLSRALRGKVWGDFITLCLMTTGLILVSLFLVTLLLSWA